MTKTIYLIIQGIKNDLGNFSLAIFESLLLLYWKNY